MLMMMTMMVLMMMICGCYSQQPLFHVQHGWRIWAYIGLARIFSGVCQRKS